MQLCRIYNEIDRLAPFVLSREYCEKHGAYDNSGIIVDCGGEIRGILFSLDCSARAVARATELGANCLITHHPAIFSPVSSLTERGAERNVLRCIREGISVISAHLNLDCAAGGIDESLMKALGGREAKLMHELSAGGYGRAYEIGKISAQSLVAAVEKTFRTKRALLYGDGEITRAASFCGAGLDEEAIAFAKAQGAQLVLSSDIKHHVLCEALEQGLCVLQLPHYTAENYGFKRFYETFTAVTGIEAAYFEDERFI